MLKIIITTLLGMWLGIEIDYLVTDMSYLLGTLLGLIFGILWHLYIKIKSLENSLKRQPNLHTPQIIATTSTDTTTRVKIITNRPVETSPPLLFSKSIPTNESNFTTLMARWFNNLGLTRIGIILLFFGIAFLLKYVGDKGFFPLETRLIAISIAATLLLFIGIRLRKKDGPYGLLLQGAAVGIFYLTIFAAFRLYHLIEPGTTFFLLFLTTVFSASLSVHQNAKSLAIFSMIGGFLAPLLTATGQGNHIPLFSYYLVLNLGIFAISWFKNWNTLNLVGFTFTFLIGSYWGYQFYQPAFFKSVEPFLIAFFLIYFIVSLLFEKRIILKRNQKMDGGLLFGLPIIALFLQASLVKHNPYALACSATILGGFYLLCSKILWALYNRNLQSVTKSCLAIGLCFLTLAVPFAFEGRTTTVIWALEGVLLFWVGIRKNAHRACFAGVILQMFASFSFVLSQNRTLDALPILNSFYSSTILFALCQWLISFLLTKESHLLSQEKDFARVFFIAGILWWFIGGYIEISESAERWYDFYTRNITTPLSSGLLQPPSSFTINCLIIYFSISILLFQTIANKIQWKSLGSIRFGFMPVLFFTSFYLTIAATHPFENIGSFAWIIAFVIHYKILRNCEVRRNEKFQEAQHTLPLWLLTALLTWESTWYAQELMQGSMVWSHIMLILIPIAICLGTMHLRSIFTWPIGTHYITYLTQSLVPILIWIYFIFVILNITQTGEFPSLYYLPLLNPLDLVSLFGVIVLIIWYKEIEKSRQVVLSKDAFFNLLASIIFMWLTAILIRSLHHWIYIAWTWDTLWRSNIVQACLSVFWSINAFGLMIFASLHQLRKQWIMGAGLLAIVVLKLFIIDLSGTGTLSRIFSFIGTGILLLLIGYFAPLPQTKKEGK